MKETISKLEFAEQLVFAKTGASLTDIQRAVLREAEDGEGKTYDKIADALGYSRSYIKQTVAPRLWKLLSEALGEKINKTNFRAVLERRLANQETSQNQHLIEILRRRLEPYRAGGVRLATYTSVGSAFSDSLYSELPIENKIKPIFCPPLTEWERPEGRVPLASPFYVRRLPHERFCYEEILKPGALIQIEAPRQLGKSSLMMRILAEAATRGCLAVHCNFQQADRTIVARLDRLLRWFACEVTCKLRLEPKLKDYWRDELGHKASCTKYFQDYLLGQIDRPLVVALDEMNEIFQHPEVARDFMLLLRSWHEEAKDSKLWQKLRLVVANSTEVYLHLDTDRSVFLGGLPIRLRSLSWEQVEDLARRHGLNLPKEDLTQLQYLVAGHPYLLRLAFYQMARDNLTLEALLFSTASDTGIYREHLRELWWMLQKHPDLAAGFAKVVKAKAPVELEPVEAFKLDSLGLVNRKGDRVITRCYLYERYFSDRNRLGK